jgi:hypothetical protein
MICCSDFRNDISEATEIKLISSVVHRTSQVFQTAHKSLEVDDETHAYTNQVLGVK